MTSKIIELLEPLAKLPPVAARLLLADLLDAFTPAELAAANYDWSLWARLNQIIDPGGDWQSHGFQTGRGFGKTMSNVSHAIDEVQAGRAKRIALVGQNEESTIEILVTGATGLIALAPPWMNAVWEPSSSLVRFGNGAIATVYSAEAPDTLRGPQHDLAIATEIAAWPRATAGDAMSNLRLGLRLGYGRLLWDSTPKARSELIKEMRADAAAYPGRHVIVEGKSDENEINLPRGRVEEWRGKYGGTRKGREELDGEAIREDEAGMFKKAWIEGSRRPAPSAFLRRIIAIDPATTARARSDSTGIIDMGRAADAQIHVLGDLSGKHRPEDWPAMVVAAYIAGDCDCVVCETNMGGTTWRALLTPAAAAKGLSLVEIGIDEKPMRRAGIFYYRPIHSRGTKAARAMAAAAHVERKRVSFGPGLEYLEQALYDFDGSEGKPDDRVDGFTSGVYELAGDELGTGGIDPRAAFRGIDRLTSAITAPSLRNIATLIGTGNGGGRI